MFFLIILLNKSSLLNSFKITFESQIFFIFLNDLDTTLATFPAIDLRPDNPFLGYSRFGYENYDLFNLISSKLLDLIS
jgi:hypothetical protein